MTDPLGQPSRKSEIRDNGVSRCEFRANSLLAGGSGGVSCRSIGLFEDVMQDAHGGAAQDQSKTK